MAAGIRRFDAQPAGAAPSFIHRDYPHPGNTLWTGGRLTAIVDWTLASFGPPEFDAAHMRANLALSYSLATADAFLEAYDTLTGGPAYDPSWDIRAVLDWVAELPAGSRAGRGALAAGTLSRGPSPAIGAGA